MTENVILFWIVSMFVVMFLGSLTDFENVMGLHFCLLLGGIFMIGVCSMIYYV